MTARGILVVEDEAPAAEYLALLLEEEGFEARTARNGVEALVELEAHPCELVLADLHMPEMDGLELLARVKRRWPELPVVMVTADGDVPDVVEAVQLGATNYLVKPVPPAAVLAAVGKALSARVAPPPETGSIPELVGPSRAMVEVRERVALAARSDVPVLLTGETGTGKELAARAIHRCSRLATGPFVAHNCALAPRDLVESEFFGHRRGAFTGADRDHVGLFERADGGVLFLDELEALPPEHQAKLLRVLEDGLVRPVGGDSVRQVSVRFLAATNRDPREMIDREALREDLFYRLRGFEIELPPLRERPEDVAPLAVHFDHPGSAGFTAEALAGLAAAPWPGNVRELRNAVRSARAAAGDAPIGVEHLSLPRARSGPAARRPPAPRGFTLRELERQAIVEALEQCEGNRTRAARMLDIDRSTLRRKIQQLEIE